MEKFLKYLFLATFDFFLFHIPGVLIGSFIAQVDRKSTTDSCTGVWPCVSTTGSLLITRSDSALGSALRLTSFYFPIERFTRAPRQNAELVGDSETGQWKDMEAGGVLQTNPH